jgi:hypothetical protein
MRYSQLGGPQSGDFDYAADNGGTIGDSARWHVKP